MARILQRLAIAVSAAALLSTQAYAAPAQTRAALDPLVTLSVLGTAQSKAAVCAAGSSAAAAGAAAVALQAPGGCLLPLTDPPPPPPGKSIGWVPIALGAVALAILAWVLLDDDDDGPVSPA